MAKIDKIKQRSFLAREYRSNAIILFGKKGKSLPIFVTDYEREGASRVSAIEVLHILEAKPDEKTVGRSGQFEAKYMEALSRLFQQDKLPDNKGRRGDAITTLDALKSEWPIARTHCEDAKRIIKDLDGFPEGLLKRIVDLQKQYFGGQNKDFEGAHKELVRITPIEYMEDLQKRVRGCSSEPDTLVIAEELV